MDYDVADNPLITRYASKEMSKLFSMRERIETWRLLWVVLAEEEQKLGLPITDQQIAALKNKSTHISWNIAEQREKEVRHDVMAHVYTYGVDAPEAAPIIHLGATSCYVTDNTDIMIMIAAMKLLSDKLIIAMDLLKEFANEHKELPILGLTHLQPAQPVTLGKRVCTWISDLLIDYGRLHECIKNTPTLGCVGATGTMASFVELFDGDIAKAIKLHSNICNRIGRCAQHASGQTYSRKIDSWILETVSGIGESVAKMATDIRLMQSRKEVEEPFGKNQIGSSAMAYKRNPMRSERICSLARYLTTLPLSSKITHSTQWMERTLDDSAIRRIIIPNAFLAADAILELCINISKGLVVHEDIIKKNLENEIPFMITEGILMIAVKSGGDRQELHEELRNITQQYRHNPTMVECSILASPTLRISDDELASVKQRLIGACVEITSDMVGQVDAIKTNHKWSRANYSDVGAIKV